MMGLEVFFKINLLFDVSLDPYLENKISISFGTPFLPE
jgi:hypothetical protein